MIEPIHRTSRPVSSALALPALACGLSMALGAGSPPSDAAPPEPPAAAPREAPPAPQAPSRPSLSEADLAALVETWKKALAAAPAALESPAVALVIVVGDEVVLADAVGQRRLAGANVAGGGEPADSDTLFAIGSTTKAMTATMIATLVDQGVVHWDSRIRRLLPSVRFVDVITTRDCTLRDLLSHRSGIMRTDISWIGGGASEAQVIEAFLRAEPTHPFRSTWQYNNNGYQLAATAVATEAGSDWHTLLRTRLFEPLRMSRTITQHEAILAAPNRTDGYETTPDGGVRPTQLRNLSAVAPAGAVWSSARDLGQWLRLLIDRGRFEGNRLISTERIEETWAPQIAVSGANANLAYGLGWLVTNWRGERFITHDGGIDGFAATIGVLPESRIGYALLSNRSGAAVGVHAQQVVLGALAELARRDVRPAKAPEPAAEGVPDPGPGAEVAPDNFARYVGLYRLDSINADVTVLVRDGTLAIDVPGQTVYALLPADATGKRFLEATDEIAIRFEADDSGAIIGATLFQAGLELELPRLGVPIKPELSDEEARPYLGTFRDPRLGEDVSVRYLAHGRLGFDVPGQMVYELRREQGDRWRLRMMPMMALTFNRDQSNAVVSITFTQGREEVLFPRTGQLPPDESAAKLERILAAHVAAQNVVAVEALAAIRMRGEARFVNQGLTGTVEQLGRGMDWASHRIELGFAGVIREAIRGLEGERDNPWDRFAPLTSEAIERRRLAAAWPLATMDSTLRATAELVGSDGEGPALVHRVRLRTAGGSSAVYHLRDSTGLVERIEAQIDAAGIGPLPLTVGLEEYREVQGVPIAHRVVLESPLFGRLILNFTEVLPNQSIAESAWRIEAR